MPSHIATFEPSHSPDGAATPALDLSSSAYSSSKPLLSSPFLLSKNCCPVPGKIVANIESLQFVDMRELLPDNIALSERLATLLQFARAQQHSFGQRDISSITSWACAFVTYIAVLAQKSTELIPSRLAYLRNIMREAYRTVGEGWRTYDYVFRNQAAADPSLELSEIVPALALAYLQPLGFLPKVPCPLCQEPDHSAANCALAPLAHPSQLTVAPGSAKPRSTPPAPTKFPSRLPDGSQLCVSWNQGACSASGPVCRYKHVCGSCSKDHIARDCKMTPESSVFKRPPKRPARY